MAKPTRRSSKTQHENGQIAVLESDELEELNSPVAETQHSKDEEDEEEERPTISGIAERAEIEKTGRGSRAHKKVPSVGFFARLTAFTKEEWETQLMLYLYRLAPITDRLATGNQVKYIARFTEPIDEDTILKDKLWGGSGKYRATLNRRDPASGRSSAVDQVEFEIEQVSYPPVVPKGEWVDDPRNRRWAWARKDEDLPATAAPAAPPQPQGPTIKDMVEGVKAINELTKAPAAPAGPDPAEQFAKTVETVSRIVEMAKPAPAPPPPAPDHSMQTYLLTELSAERAANRELMGKLLERASTPNSAEKPVDPLHDLAMELLKKKLEEPAGETSEAARSRMSGTQELITELTKAVAPVLEKAMGLFTVMAASKQAAAPQAQAARARTPRPDAPAIDPGVPVTTGEQAGQQAATEQPTGQGAPTMQQMEEAQRKILNHVLTSITPTMLGYLKDYEPAAEREKDDPGTGASFAAWFCDCTIALPLPGVPEPYNHLPGIEAHKLTKKYGKDLILQGFQGNAGLWGQIAPTEEAGKIFGLFLDEFLAYDPNAPEN